MAFPHPLGLLPSEVAFLCEMELVTIVPRQRLERLDLLGGPTNPLNPPSRTTLPLWLALLLKRQRRINIIPPPWLEPEVLREILELETQHFEDQFSPAAPLPPLDVDKRSKSRNAQMRTDVQARVYDADANPLYLSPPFIESCTATAEPTNLPYHYYDFAHLLLDAAPDDLVNPDLISNLLRDLREVRQSKIRRGYAQLTDGSEGVRLDGIGAMELSESRGFMMGVMAGLRGVGGSREQARREEEREERDRQEREQDDDDMDEGDI